MRYISPETTAVSWENTFLLFKNHLKRRSASQVTCLSALVPPLPGPVPLTAQPVQSSRHMKVRMEGRGKQQERRKRKGKKKKKGQEWQRRGEGGDSRARLKVQSCTQENLPPYSRPCTYFTGNSVKGYGVVQIKHISSEGRPQLAYNLTSIKQ